jgi:phosphoribosylanthranilate isomerase
LDHDGAEWGGSGKTIDWAKAKEFIEQCKLPVILAGGINAENIELAIHSTHPNGVDISSGVESSPGIKSPEKLKLLFNTVRPK